MTFSILGWIISAFTSLYLLKTSVDKLRGTSEMMSNFSYMKLEKYRIPTGIGELLASILFLIPETSLWGMVLICSFMSAAVVIHLALMGGNRKGLPILIGLASILSYLLRQM